MTTSKETLEHFEKAIIRYCEEWTRPSLEESITFIADSLPEINKHKIEKVDWKKEGF